MDEVKKATPAPAAGPLAGGRLTLRLVWAAVALMLAVTSASAWLRLAQPRPDCGEWPQCRAAQAASVVGAFPAPGGQTVLAAGVAPARALHRVAATLVLLLAVWLTVGSTRADAALRPVCQPARWLLGVALALAALGLAGGASRSVVVVLANQAGGFVLLALAWVIVRRLRGDAAPPGAAARRLTLLALAWLAQAGLGALSGAGTLAAAPLHLALAVLVLPLALISGAEASKQGLVREGRALLGLAGFQAVAGGCAVAFGAPAPLVLVHNVSAAIGLALVAGLADAAWGQRAQASV